MRIGVFGAGSIGGYVGGRLVAAAHDVVFLGRARVKEELEASGITAVDLEGGVAVAPKQRLRIELDAESLRDRDVILCCVKSAQTVEAGEAIARHAPNALVVSLQNGLRNADTLRASIARDRVLAAIVGFNVVQKGGGVFRQATAGEILLERSLDPRLAALVSALRASGIDAKTVDDVRAHQHAKLLMNLNNAVSAPSPTPPRAISSSFPGIDASSRPSCARRSR